MTEADTTGHLHARAPARGDGKVWIPRHHRAAQLRARGWTWDKVASDIEVYPTTARDYACIPGFASLVSFYQEETFHLEVEHHFMQGSLAALDALRAQWEGAIADIEMLGERLEDEEVEESSRDAITRAISSRSKDVVGAADKFLHAIGFVAYRKRTCELEAENRVQGHYGQAVRHSGGDAPIEVVGDPGARAMEVAAILASVLPKPTEEDD